MVRREGAGRLLDTCCQQPATTLFVGLNCAAFWWISKSARKSANPPSSQRESAQTRLLKKFAISSESLARPWTLLSHMFMHLHSWHLAENMLSLWNTMPVCECLLGPGAASAVYLKSGALSGLLQYGYNRCTYGTTEWYGLGASGAVCGVHGATLTTMWLTSRMTLANAVSNAFQAVCVPWLLERMLAPWLLERMLAPGSSSSSGFTIGHVSHLAGLATGVGCALALEANGLLVVHQRASIGQLIDNFQMLFTNTAP